MRVLECPTQSMSLKTDTDQVSKNNLDDGGTGVMDLYVFHVSLPPGQAVTLQYRSSLVTQRVKDQALSLQQLGSLLCRSFHPWPRNFCMPGGQPKIDR